MTNCIFWRPDQHNIQFPDPINCTGVRHTVIFLKSTYRAIKSILEMPVSLLIINIFIFIVAAATDPVHGQVACQFSNQPDLPSVFGLQKHQ